MPWNGRYTVDTETWFDFDRLLFDTGRATLQPSSQGYGDTRPVAGNDMEEDRAKNRRISVRVTAK